MRPRVLFVEDEESISGPFSSALTREGFDPVVAGSLAEAGAALAGGVPGLVLPGLMLPGGGGRGLGRELRGASGGPIVWRAARGGARGRGGGVGVGGRGPVSGPEAAGRL